MGEVADVDEPLTVDLVRQRSLRFSGLFVESGRLIRTGIFIRAKSEEGWEAVDIAVLDKKSLLRFLRARGGKNVWAENVVGILLGHVGSLVGEEG